AELHLTRSRGVRGELHGQRRGAVRSRELPGPGLNEQQRNCISRGAAEYAENCMANAEERFARGELIAELYRNFCLTHSHVTTQPPSHEHNEAPPRSPRLRVRCSSSQSNETTNQHHIHHHETSST